MIPLLLTGCPGWPDAVIQRIEPSEMVASQATAVELQAELPLPTTVDYGEETAAIDPAAALFIGDQELGDGQYPAGGTFRVRVPTLFAPGSYDVRIRLADGREAVAPAGFTVTEGQWPTGYELDPIPPQRAFVPFTITVRALGPAAPTFAGNVRLEVPAGASVGPRVSDPFVGGVLTQQVVVSSPRAQELLIVTDVSGNRVTSAPFEVR